MAIKFQARFQTTKCGQNTSGFKTSRLQISCDMISLTENSRTTQVISTERLLDESTHHLLLSQRYSPWYDKPVTPPSAATPCGRSPSYHTGTDTHTPPQSTPATGQDEVPRPSLGRPPGPRPLYPRSLRAQRPRLQITFHLQCRGG